MEYLTPIRSVLRPHVCSVTLCQVLQRAATVQPELTLKCGIGPAQNR